MLLSFVSMCVPSELNPHPFALLTQCSTSEPQEHLEIVWALRQTHTITAAFFMSWPACCFTWSICVFALITTPILLALCSAVRFIQDLKRPLHLTFDSYCYMNLSISQLYSSRLSYQTPAMGTVDLCHPTSAAHPHQVQHTTTHQCIHIHTCRSTTFPIITSCPSSLLM